MSSWVIDRKEYIKCAGFIAGLQKTESRLDKSILWLWNYKEMRLYTAEEIKNEFLKVFACNVKSVCDQYNGWREMQLLKEPESKEEKDLFKKYIAKGRELAYDKEKLLQAILKFSIFISCFDYQTEDREENEKGMAWLERCLFRVTGVLEKLEDNREWGEFNL